MPAKRVRAATLADCDELGIVAPAAYIAQYGYLWDDSAALARQLSTFSADAFRHSMERSDTRLWVAQDERFIVGFLTMVVGSSDPIRNAPHGAEIPRIYLLPTAQGHGLGRQLLDTAADCARDHGSVYVWLDVMATANHARHAYASWGFIELGSKTFNKPVKPELTDMIVMIRSLQE